MTQASRPRNLHESAPVHSGGPNRKTAIRQFERRLVNWGREHRRPFAWRATRDPYRILVAELLLQRTAATQVEPVYLEFIKRFPSLHALALASETSVARIIESLGLRYRARRLRSMARRIANVHDGKIPSSESELLELPGVGRYTANALRCFAFGRAVALVDTNVARVVSRVFEMEVGKEPHKETELWDFMTSVIEETSSARDLNLAILDHAHMVCTPREPHCGTCPLSIMCRYRIKFSQHCS